MAAAGSKPSTEPTSSRIVAGFARAARAASLAAAVIGAVVCVGWLTGVRALVQLHPGLAEMKLNTAVTLILLGAALWLAIGRRAARVVHGLAAAAIAVTAATLVEYAAGINLGIDQLVVRDVVADGARGRMSPATAASLLLLAAAVLGLASQWAERLGLLVMLSAHVAVLGYLYGVRDLYAIGPYSAVALHTAVAIYLLAAAVVGAEGRPRGVLALLARDSPGGVLARQLVPAALVVPAVLALVLQWGERAGWYSTGFVRAMLVVSSSVIFMALIRRAAVETDDLHQLAEQAMRESEESREASLISVVRSGDRLRALARVSDAFAAVATTYQPLLDEIARAVADLVGDGCMVTLLSDDGERLCHVANAHRERALTADYKTYLAGLEVVRVDSPSISARVARTGQPIRAEVTPGEMVAQSDEALRPIVERLHIHGFATVPIRARQTVIGTLSVVRNAPGRSYTGEDVTLLQDLADRAGLAIENARLYARLEQRVQERTAELEAANQELEAFSSSVAHDLRAPLRAISGFSHALLEDAADRLTSDDARRARQIRDAASRMNELIDALLDLARISRTEPRRRRVDISELARKVLAGLRATQPDRAVEIAVTDGLLAHADPRLLEIVLTNLLGNAWKFTGKRAQAQIELGALPGNHPVVYFVRDNGAGFDPAQTDKLFGVFQRLHAAHEFEGTGVGLATVQRIIHRHGGVIWAESELDRGTTFYFTLEAVKDRAALPRSPS
ncbi:MAG: GAF domain-containing protein [Deltaproteobacteria bacterium]|nr:MAG: GAF domain-containing protein [Deltaproteobacteria bacterium]TMQ22084.1 MAG: GAF domain-containing protein [Deltaproteobacteria bacterium]